MEKLIDEFKEIVGEQHFSSLLKLDEEPTLAQEPSDENEMVFDLVDGLCSEANMINERESARGEDYSIAEKVILEYSAWYNMSGEDY